MQHEWKLFRRLGGHGWLQVKDTLHLRPAPACINQAAEKDNKATWAAPKPELPESRAVLSKWLAPLSRLWLMPGAGGPCGHLAGCSLPGLQWAVPHYQGGRAPPTPTGKDGGPLHAASPDKSPPLSLSFPKVCPSGPGHLLAGAALAVPQHPGQQGSNPHAPIPHTPQRVLASRPQMESRRHRSLRTAGSCRAGCPSRGPRSLEPATSLIGKSCGAAWAGQELACQALAAPFYHWASQRPTMCWALCQALGQGVENRPPF